MITNAQQLIEYDEGRKLTPYVDTTGHLTFGVGHNMSAAPLCPQALLLLNQAVDVQFAHDQAEALDTLDGYPWYADLDPVRQAALLDMLFNLGSTIFSQFTTFLAYMARSTWNLAADDLRTTRVYRELPVRYERLAQMIETGRWPVITGA